MNESGFLMILIHLSYYLIFGENVERKDYEIEVFPITSDVDFGDNEILQIDYDHLCEN